MNVDFSLSSSCISTCQLSDFKSNFEKRKMKKKLVSLGTVTYRQSLLGGWELFQIILLSALKSTHNRLQSSFFLLVKLHELRVLSITPAGINTSITRLIFSLCSSSKRYGVSSLVSMDIFTASILHRSLSLPTNKAVFSFSSLSITTPDLSDILIS